MLSFLFLTCCFLIIIACSEGAETRQTCSTNDFPSGCTLSGFRIILPSYNLRYTDSQLTTLNQQLSRACTQACITAITKYFRCIESGDQQEYRVNFFQKYSCGKHSNGDYCPVRLLRSTIGSTATTDLTNARALVSIQASCSIAVGSTGITCSSSTSSRCTNALSTVSSYMGCCTEPFLGSGVRSCSGVSNVPAACTGVSATTGVSSATGIMATAPIVAVSLMVFALVGVLL